MNRRIRGIAEFEVKLNIARLATTNFASLPVQSAVI